MPVPGFTKENIEKQRLRRGPVTLAIPMTEFVYRTAFWNFGFLFRDGMKMGDHLIPTIEVAVPAEARNDIIRKFLNDKVYQDSQFLLIFDSDMILPLEIIDAMTGYDLPFISGYTTLKIHPYTPIPSVRSDEMTIDGEQGYRQITNWEPYSGIKECDGTGAAALCLRRDLLEAMEPPYFKHGALGEDYYFCQNVQRTRLPDYPDGVPILVSTDIPVGHLGEKVAYPHDWFANKEQFYRENPGRYDAEAGVFGIQRKVTQAAD